ncbi:MAG TPA: RagB/SusD family nutrient uptake outer membrane protein [Mucilaginibacter sp.]
MNKKNITLIALFAAMLIPLSCKKNFLTNTDTYQSTLAATFNKSSDVVAMVNGIYDGFQSSDLLKKSMWYYANFLSHDFFNYGADVVWNNYQITSLFGQLSTFWGNGYIVIARANTAIDVIAASRAKGIVTQALADRLTGEAYFLRGLMYYYLAGSFSGVPLELKQGSNGLAPRSTQDQVFAQVVADMKQAENLLVSKTTLPAADLGRATKGSAYAYEGAAQMWLKNYTAALAAFNNTELTSNYHLLPNFVDVHEFDHQNNDESLFEIQFDINGSQSWDGNWQDGGEVAWIDDFSWPEEVSGFGYDYANPGLWYSYQAGDLRKGVTILGPGDPNLSPGIIAKWGGIKGYPNVQGGYQSNPIRYSDGAGHPINTNGTVTHPWYGVSDQKRSGYMCAKKWRDPTLTGATGNPTTIFGSQNQILMRYAEVLLDRAECKIRTGDVAGGLADVQLVRNRAWGGAAPAVVQDGANFDGSASAPITDPLQIVLSEYRHELTGEYSVFYDLRRAGPGVAAAFIHAAYGTDATTAPQPYPFGPTADGNLHGVWRTALPAGRDLLPIPQSAIGLNPNLTQNPAYN